MGKAAGNGGQQTEREAAERPPDRNEHIVIVNGVPVDVRYTGDIFDVKSRPERAERELERPQQKKTYRAVLLIVLLVTAAAIVIPILLSGKQWGNSARSASTTVAWGGGAGQNAAGVSTTSVSAAERTLLHPDGTTDTKGYTAPGDLGDDIRDARMSLDGKLYQFPFPLALLTGDGWDITAIDSGEYHISEDTEIDPESTEFVQLQDADGRTLFCELWNFSSDAANITECAVISVTEYGFDPVGIRISGGPDGLLTLEQMDQLLADAGPETSDSTFSKREQDGYTYFVLRFPKQEMAKGVWSGPVLDASFDEDGLLDFWYGVEVS